MAAPTRTPRNREGRMPLAQHLLEFRRRLFISAITVVIGAIGGFVVAEWVWGQLREPLRRISEEQGRLADVSYTYVTEPFDTRLQIAFIVALIIASPVWLYQIWAFFMPALHRNEKRLALGFLLTAVPLFLAGCYVGWLVLPNMVTLMIGFAPEDAPSLLTAKVYLDFTAKLLIAVGIAFVLPVFLVLFNIAGVISAIQILKNWRIAIIVIATFAALATPASDIVTMLILMGAMSVLYFAAAGIAALNDRRAARRLAKLTDEGVPA